MSIGPGRVGRRRVVWGLSTQALSSISNFVIGIIVIRSVSLEEFGAFGIAIALYLFVVGAFRAFGAKTFALRYAGAPLADQRRGQGALTGLALGLGLVVGAIGLGVSTQLPGPVGSTVAVVSVFLPLLLLQDAWRFSFVAMGRPKQATANDAAWIVLQAMAIAVVLLALEPTAANLLAAWAGAGAVAGLIGMAQAGVLPSIGAGRRFMHDHRDVNWFLVGEHVASQGANQAGVLALGAILPLSSIGALRSGQLMLSPLNVLQQAAPLVGLPEASRARLRSRAELSRIVSRVAIGLAAAAAVLTVVLLVLPDSIGTAIFGDGWQAGSSILVPLGLRNVAGGFTIAAFLGLQALGHPQRTLAIGAGRGLMSLTATIAMGLAFGLEGAVWAMAAADAVAAVLAITVFRRASRADRGPARTDEDGQRRDATSIGAPAP